MGSTPNRGPTPSSSQTTSLPQSATELGVPLSSKPSQPQDVTLEKSLIRSGTFESNSSTATTLVDGSHVGDVQPPPRAPADGDTRSSSNPTIYSKISELESQEFKSPALTSDSSFPAPVLPAVKDGVNRDDSSSPQDLTHAESVAPFTIPWIKSLLKNAPHKTLARSLMSLAGCICGVVSTLLYTYKSYQISLWQAEQAFYDHCKEWAAKPSELGFEVCSVILKEPLRQPPYVRSEIKVKHLKRDLPANQPALSLRTWNRDNFIIYLIILLGLLFAAYGTIILYRCQRWRRIMQAWDEGRPWDSNAI